MTTIVRNISIVSLVYALLICFNATAIERRVYLKADVEITRKQPSGGALASQLLLESAREAPYRERAYAHTRLLNAYAALIEAQLQEAQRQQERNKPNYVKIIMGLNKAKFKAEQEKRGKTKTSRPQLVEPKVVVTAPVILESVPTTKREPSFAVVVYAMKFKRWLVQSGYPLVLADAAYNHVLNCSGTPQNAAIQCMKNMGLPKPKIQSAIVLIKRVSLK